MSDLESFGIVRKYLTSFLPRNMDFYQGQVILLVSKSGVLLTKVMLKVLQQGGNRLADEGSVHCCDMEALMNVKREKVFYTTTNERNNIKVDYKSMAKQMLGSRFRINKLKHYCTAATHFDSNPRAWAYVTKCIISSKETTNINFLAFAFGDFWKQSEDDMISILRMLHEQTIKGKKAVVHEILLRKQGAKFFEVIYRFEDEISLVYLIFI